MRTKRYRIVVEGRLSERFADGFGLHGLDVHDGVTVLDVDIVDQAHLYGLLDGFRDFALELVKVEKIEEVP